MTTSAHNRTKKINAIDGAQVREAYYRGKNACVLPTVYEPSDDTYLLIEAALSEVRSSDSVLEVGTGCGLIAKIVAESAHSVIATDINPLAVANANLNGVRAIHGDLFANLNHRFDLILFNPPYLPSDDLPHDLLAKAWDGGPSGRNVIVRFLSQINSYLTDKGRVLIVISSVTDYKKVIEEMMARFKVVKTVEERRFFYETLFVILGAHA